MSKHPKWHKFFKSCYRIVSYRDGFLGSLTPDFDEYFYRCDIPWCNWENKEEKIIGKMQTEIKKADE